VQIAGKL